nr:ParA family protein [Nakamurella lactea]
MASVLSLKGGVGKTTVALGLASAAAQRGVRTVLVDLDPQANLTATLVPDHDASAAPTGGLTTIAEVLADPRRKVVRKALRPSAWSGRLQVLVGSEHAETHNHPDPGSKRLSRLATAIEKLPGGTELVIIDCPPSLGQLTRSALVASDRAVLVTEPSLYAVTGVQRALEAVQAERAAHQRGLQPLGVVVNRMRPRSVEHEYRLAELHELFGPLVLRPILPDRAAIQQAQGAAVPIHQWPSPGAKEIAGMFDALLDRLLRAGDRRRVRPVPIATVAVPDPV